MKQLAMDEMSKAFTMFFWELGQSNEAQLLGISFVQDMSKYSMTQMRNGMKAQKQMDSTQKKTSTMSRDALPLRCTKMQHDCHLGGHNQGQIDHCPETRPDRQKCNTHFRGQSVSGRMCSLDRVFFLLVL